jgi:hypothetical protein
MAQDGTIVGIGKDNKLYSRPLMENGKKLLVQENGHLMLLLLQMVLFLLSVVIIKFIKKIVIKI